MVLNYKYLRHNIIISEVNYLDNELKNMLVQILEGQTRIETEVKKNSLEIKKNSIKIEDLEKNISAISEVQTAHKEQSSNDFLIFKINFGVMLNERIIYK